MRASTGNYEHGRMDGPPQSRNGRFTLNLQGVELHVVASDGPDWEHVSVSTAENRCPNWAEMCWIKDQFFQPSEWVVQFHPSRDQYVNWHPYTLHLWRPISVEFPKPESSLVGPRTPEEVETAKALESMRKLSEEMQAERKRRR